MAKKAAARKSTAKRTAKKTARRTAAARAAARRRGRGVDFKPMHDAMDAAIAELTKYKRGVKRDALLKGLKVLRKFKPCPRTGMFVELE
jgi:sRNA-binding protein